MEDTQNPKEEKGIKTIVKNVLIIVVLLAVGLLIFYGYQLVDKSSHRNRLEKASTEWLTQQKQFTSISKCESYIDDEALNEIWDNIETSDDYYTQVIKGLDKAIDCTESWRGEIWDATDTLNSDLNNIKCEKVKQPDDCSVINNLSQEIVERVNLAEFRENTGEHKADVIKVTSCQADAIDDYLEYKTNDDQYYDSLLKCREDIFPEGEDEELQADDDLEVKLEELESKLKIYSLKY